MALTLQAIFEAAYPAYAATRRLPVRIQRAARAIRRCRTRALGWHHARCPQGHVEQTRYNSCRHRSCPQCGAARAQRWLAAQAGRLLPCRHFQVVFTVAHELLPLWQYNRRAVGQALFGAARDALRQLLGQDRHLGAYPGLVFGLHSWGGDLSRHLHLHALVTGGGLTTAGHWRDARRECLIWGPILRDVFRGKFLQRLERLHLAGELTLPAGAAAVRALLEQSTQQKWHVRVEKPYAHGRGLAVYLARYLRGGPIKNHRLVAFDGRTVTFDYRDHRRADRRGQPRWGRMELPVETFLDRVLQHVPVSGTHLVRSYGLYAAVHHQRLERARAVLLSLAPAALGAADPDPAARRSAHTHCPVCGTRLVVVTVVRPAPRASPPAHTPTGPAP
jgi:hypothetical protein